MPGAWKDGWLSKSPKKRRYPINTKRFAPTILVVLITAFLGWSVPAAAQVEEPVLPNITFLGEGPQTFTIDPSLLFVIKTYTNNEFLFVTLQATTYQAKRNERVWSTDTFPSSGVRLFDEWISYGNYDAGCLVNFVQIEDNIDTRRNTFYINNNPLLTVEQGMVVYGSFTVPETGELTFFAEDSIGMIITPCQAAPGPTLTPTTEASATVTQAVLTSTPTITETQAVVTSTSTATQDPLTDTATPTLPVQATTPVGAQTDQPSQTPTPSATSGATLGTPFTPTPPLNTATASATFTQTPPSNTNAETSTPVPNPPQTIPPTGGGPGPREIAIFGTLIAAAFALLGGAWWYLLRWRRHG